MATCQKNNEKLTLIATLLNDTSVINHYGCKLVVKNIIEISEIYNIKIISRIPVGKAWYKNDYKEKILNSDLVIVNGEGTLHHSRQRALKLVSVASFCKKYSIPCFLINSVYQSNNDILNDHTKNFTKVFVRESLSQKELEKILIKSEVVPDMTFYSTIFFQNPRNISKQDINTTIYSGSTYPSVSNYLYIKSTIKKEKFVTISKKENIEIPERTKKL